MKLNKLIIAVVAAAASFTAGCDSMLDVTNSDRLNMNNMWVDASDVTGATNGIYSRLRTAFAQTYTNQFFWGELRVGPAMWDRGTGRTLMDSDMLEVLHSTMSSSTASTNWTALYTCIDQCNSVLKYAPEVGMDEATRKYCMGNAHFVRAFTYYWVVRVWGDAPLITAPTESTGNEIYPSRSSKADLYALIASDIEAALGYITSNSAGAYYATVNNINMLKADYALWMYSVENGGNSYLAMAGDALDAVTNPALLASFTDVFDVTNKRNNEIAFAIYCNQTNEQHSAGYIQRFIWGPSLIREPYRNVVGGVPVYSNQWFNYSDAYITELKANKADNGDQRTDVTYGEMEDVSDNYNPAGWPNKFTGNWSSGTMLFDDDLILYRYAQYYMFRAELCYYRNDYPGANGYLNTVAARAYGKAGFYTSTAQADVLEALAKESRWEFAEEGNLWFTYIRLGYIDTYCPLKYWSNTGVQGGVGGSTNPNILVFPVRREAMTLNNNITQTKGWS